MDTDILLNSSGDIHISQNGDIVVGKSVAQKIRIKILWFSSEWKWDEEEGLPYKEELFTKNPDIDTFESYIREAIFEVEEVTNVGDVKITYDNKTRKANVKFVAYTDFETIKEEVVI